MTRGIVSIHVGHCGCNLGSSFWDMINREHHINQKNLYDNYYDFDYQLKNIDVYYNETIFCKFIPREIFVDIDKESIEKLNNNNNNNINSSNIIYSESASHNNWASGFYPENRDLIEEITEMIRIEVDECDSLSGFHLFHSVGGGGLGSLILNELRDEYPEQVISTFSIFPSRKVDDRNYCTMSYNCILSLNQLIHAADEVFYFDNEEFYDICFKKLKNYNPTFNYLNYPILCCMSSITSSLRYPDNLNSDLRKIYNNIIPFTHLKFIKSTFLPYHLRGECCWLMSLDRLSLLFSDKNDNIRFCSYLNLNGNFKTNEVNKQMEIIKSKENIDIKSSIYNNFIGISRSATLIENSTQIKTILERQKKDFSIFYKKRLFNHCYICEGLDDADFEDANIAITNLIQDYEYFSHTSEEEEDYI